MVIVLDGKPLMLSFVLPVKLRAQMVGIGIRDCLASNSNTEERGLADADPQAYKSFERGFITK